MQLHFVVKVVYPGHFVLLHLGLQNAFVAVTEVALLSALLIYKLLGQLLSPRLPFFFSLSLLISLLLQRLCIVLHVLAVDLVLAVQSLLLRLKIALRVSVVGVIKQFLVDR